MKPPLFFLLNLAAASLTFGSCSPYDLKFFRPYEEPESRFPKYFSYQCPDYDLEAPVCPFDNEPNDKVVFSGPLSLGHDGDPYEPRDFNYDLLYDSLRLIDSVPPGEDIYATTFYFSASSWGMALRDSLVCAAERGVNVNLIIGNPIEENQAGELEPNQPTKMVLDGLEQFAAGHPYLNVNRCTGGCLREGSTFEGKQHSKFFAVSRGCNGTSHDSDIVGVSSNNWTSSLVTRDNSTVFKRNDPKLYSAFSRYFKDMVAAETQGAHANNYYDAPDEEGGVLGTGSGTDLNYRYYLFPREDGPDVVDETFSQLRCDDDTEIRISMSRWTTKRSAIVDTLIDLAKEGCSIRIIVGDEPSEASLRSYLVDAAAQVNDLMFEYRYLPSPEFHDKYFMIEGVLPEIAKRGRFVWSGSHNFSKSSLLTNEEAALGIFDEDQNQDGSPDNQLYDDFLEHFEFQWKRSSVLK